MALKQLMKDLMIAKKIPTASSGSCKPVYYPNRSIGEQRVK
jgi:hypothetical protein